MLQKQLEDTSSSNGWAPKQGTAPLPAGLPSPHLQVNAIEFIKASPSATGGQALEELGHGDGVQCVTAVENYALTRQGFCQVLGCLCFASSSRSAGYDHISK